MKDLFSTAWFLLFVAVVIQMLLEKNLGLTESDIIWIWALLGVIFAFLRYRFSDQFKVKQAQDKVIPTNISNFMHGHTGTITGRVCSKKTFAAPITGRPCVFSRVLVEERRGVRSSAHWAEIINEITINDIVITDERLYAFIDSQSVICDAQPDIKYSSGLFKNAPKNFEKFLLSRGSSSVTGFWNNGKRCEETIIDKNATISITGKGYWVETSEHNHPDFPAKRMLMIKPCDDGFVYISVNTAEQIGLDKNSQGKGNRNMLIGIALVLVVLGVLGLQRMIEDERGAGPEWSKLREEARELSRAEQHDRAEVVALKALALAEKNVRPNHADVGLSLEELAQIYHIQGDYAKAEAHYKRALAILVEARGADHWSVSRVESALATLYTTQSDYAKAEAHYKSSLAILEKASSPDDLEKVEVLHGLARLYNKHGDYAKAEPIYKRRLAILEKTIPDSPGFPESLEELAALYRATNRNEEAEPLEQRAANLRAIISKRELNL